MLADELAASEPSYGATALEAFDCSGILSITLQGSFSGSCSSNSCISDIPSCAARRRSGKGRRRSVTPLQRRASLPFGTTFLITSRLA